jgi:bifunctional DNA-binding transcriptional regulator/antitoxin component of YhaV-PrlF toxin-antitoxin module
MDNCTDIFIKYNGGYSPFAIQPRCAFHKFVTAIQNGIGITITKITHIKTQTGEVFNIPFDVSQYNKFLLEDIGIQSGDVMEIEGNVGKVRIPLKKGISAYICNVVTNAVLELTIDLDNCKTNAIYAMVREATLPKGVRQNTGLSVAGEFQLIYNTPDGNIVLEDSDDLIAKYGLTNNAIILVASV